MSVTTLIIEERSRDIGNFMVGRLLPFRRKRMVGPFIFIDHMGPTVLGPYQYLDVDQHPHIGLVTLTYLIEGEIQHRDSLGTDQIIKPGDVNWMVAGHGVTHTERTPMDLRNGQQHSLHGFQIWVALPVAFEMGTPSFHHFDSNDLPRWQEDQAHFKMIAGSGFGRSSPVPVRSGLFMVEIRTTGPYLLNTTEKISGEIGMIVVQGAIRSHDLTVGAGHMLVSKLADPFTVTLDPDTHVFLFGGEPFYEERLIYWNFVSSEQSRLEEAKERWRKRNFPGVPGDATYVEMP